VLLTNGVAGPIHRLDQFWTPADLRLRQFWPIFSHGWTVNASSCQKNTREETEENCQQRQWPSLCLLGPDGGTFHKCPSAPPPLLLLFLVLQIPKDCSHCSFSPVARSQRAPLPQQPKKAAAPAQGGVSASRPRIVGRANIPVKALCLFPLLVLLLRSPFTWLLFGHFILLEDPAKWHIDKKSGKRCAKYLRHLQDRPVQSATKCCHQVLLLASNAFLS
jgi:hypothetical protein